MHLDLVPFQYSESEQVLSELYSVTINKSNNQPLVVLAEQVVLYNTKYAMMQIIHRHMYRLVLTFNIDLGPRHVRITSAIV